MTAAVALALATAATACGGERGLAPFAAADRAPADVAARDGRYTAGPTDQGLDPAAFRYPATIATAKGDIAIELWPQLAPHNVNAFVFLARAGFYDGLTFHRVIDGFVAQGGDPLATGLGGPGFGLPAELHATDPVPIGAGAVAMARVASRPDSAGSQFFIVTGDGQPARNLTGLYTVIGWVTDGLDVAQALAEGDVIDAVTIRPRAAGGGLSSDDVRARATEASR